MKGNNEKESKVKKNNKLLHRNTIDPRCFICNQQVYRLQCRKKIV